MTEPKQRRKPRKYTDEFKQQLVELYRSGKRRCDICREYDIATSLFDKWVKQASNSGSFHEKDNRTPEQEELIRLRKENQKLRMENDILKQAALILSLIHIWIFCCSHIQRCSVIRLIYRNRAIIIFISQMEQTVSQFMPLGKRRICVSR